MGCGSSVPPAKASRVGRGSWTLQSSGCLLVSLWRRPLRLSLSGAEPMSVECLREAALSLDEPPPKALGPTEASALPSSEERGVLTLARLVCGLRSLGWRWLGSLRLSQTSGYEGSGLFRHAEAPAAKVPVAAVQVRLEDKGATLLCHDSPDAWLTRLQEGLMDSGATVDARRQGPHVTSLHVAHGERTDLDLLRFLWAALTSSGASLVAQLPGPTQINFFQVEPEQSAFQQAAGGAAEPVALCFQGASLSWAGLDPDLGAELGVSLGVLWPSGFDVRGPCRVELRGFREKEQSLAAELVDVLRRRGLCLQSSVQLADQSKASRLVLLFTSKVISDDASPTVTLRLRPSGRLSLQGADPKTYAVLHAVLKHTWEGGVREEEGLGWRLEGGAWKGEAGVARLGYLVAVVLRKLGARGWAWVAGLPSEPLSAVLLRQRPDLEQEADPPPQHPLPQSFLPSPIDPMTPSSLSHG